MKNNSKRIKPIKPKLTMEFFSKEEIDEIHYATLEVLKRKGVRFPSTKALKILEDAGAEVDCQNQIVKMSTSLAEEALSRVPSKYIMAGRDPSADLRLGEDFCYLSTDGCGVEVIDMDSGLKRSATKRDLENAAKLADSIPELSFFWPMVAAQDVSSKSRPLHELDACLNNTSKHIQSEMCVTPEDAKLCIEVLKIVSGGTDNLKKRPIYSTIQCTVSPLSHDQGSLEASLLLAEAGIPVGFMGMPMSCATAPATIAGNLLVNNIEVLSGIILLQIAFPGTPVFYASAPTVIDLHTGGYTGGGPEDFYIGGAVNQIARRYNIPSSMGVCATGSKKSDWQSGVDSSFSTLMPVLTNTDMLSGAGLLYGSRVLDFKQIVMDVEVYNIVKKLSEGAEVNKETLAVEVIEEVGSGGNFLSQRHTLKMIKDIWVPTIYDRQQSSDWQAGEFKVASEKAMEVTRELITNSTPLPLDEKIQREIKALIKDVGN